jgi:hypothetical protein
MRGTVAIKRVLWAGRFPPAKSHADLFSDLGKNQTAGWLSCRPTLFSPNPQILTKKKVTERRRKPMARKHDSGMGFATLCRLYTCIYTWLPTIRVERRVDQWEHQLIVWLRFLDLRSGQQ